MKREIRLCLQYNLPHHARCYFSRSPCTFVCLFFYEFLLLLSLCSYSWSHYYLHNVNCNFFLQAFLFFWTFFLFHVLYAFPCSKYYHYNIIPPQKPCFDYSYHFHLYAKCLHHFNAVLASLILFCFTFYLSCTFSREWRQNGPGC